MTELTDQPFDLDGRLESLFRDAPRLSADRVVAAALADVAATPQARSMFAIDATSFRLSLLAATVAALAIGLGLGLGPQLIGTDASPSPEASEESPVPSDLPDGYVRYRNEADGYEIVVPTTFQMVVEPGDGELREGVTRFGSDVRENFPPGLNVSVGSPDGTVYLCQGIACSPVVVTSIEELEAAIQARWPSLEARRERIVATSLGGEAARLRHPTAASGVAWIGANQACSAYAMHGERPVVLTVSCDGFSGGMPTNLSTLERIVDSFRFLDDETTTDATPTPTPPSGSSGFAPYWNTSDGYRLDVPRIWQQMEEPIYGGFPGVVRFTEGDGFVSGFVSVGGMDGSVFVCRGYGSACFQRTGRTLAELRDSLATVIQDIFLLSYETVTTSLGGEPAEIQFPVGSGTVTVPGQPWPYICTAYAIHEGRPVVVGVSCGGRLTSLGPPERGSLEAMTSSFQFVDGGFRFASFPEAGFEVRVPRGWSTQEFSPYGVAVWGVDGSLSVRAGDDENMIDTPAGRRVIASMSELVDVAVDWFESSGIEQSRVDFEQRPISFAGTQSGTWLSFTTETSEGPEFMDYVLAIRDGRPYILTFIQADSAMGMEDLLTGFRFLND